VQTAHKGMLEVNEILEHKNRMIHFGLLERNILSEWKPLVSSKLALRYFSQL